MECALAFAAFLIFLLQNETAVEYTGSDRPFRDESFAGSFYLSWDFSFLSFSYREQRSWGDIKMSRYAVRQLQTPVSV